MCGFTARSCGFGGAPPLVGAAAGGHATVCDALADARADVNAADSAGWTPLLALRNGRDAYTPWSEELSVSKLRVCLRERGLKPDVTSYNAAITACEKDWKEDRALDLAPRREPKNEDHGPANHDSEQGSPKQLAKDDEHRHAVEQE